jgi:hypothetical protein
MELRDFLAADHDRLDALLRAAAANGERVELEPYEAFRRGLLKHVGMEELILMPAAKAAREGKPPALFERVRRDHGALTSLLIPAPTPRLVSALRAILSEHNRMEEEQAAGLYADCEDALGAGRPALLERLRTAADIPPAAHADGPHVEAALERALAAAGYEGLL